MTCKKNSQALSTPPGNLSCIFKWREAGVEHIQRDAYQQPYSCRLNSILYPAFQQAPCPLCALLLLYVQKSD
jgi:hypothetical protein